MAQAADYVIVGGGSAGIVLAARLSEIPDNRVVLIEAGGEATAWQVQIPVGYAAMMGNPRYDWAYRHDPDASIGGRSLIWSAGRLLGGGSSLNGQVYNRGTRTDFDRWAEAGATGWGFDDCLAYFRKAEDYVGPELPSHGTGGPLTVAPMRDPHPTTDLFVKACAEIGIPTLEDYCGGDMDGAAATLATQRGGLRCSVEKAYLRPIRSRPNLEVITHAMVDRILMQDRRAVGVAGRRKDGTPFQIAAAREVIIGAGAIGSPALLIRSGIGPADQIRALGGDVVLDRTAVGANLQEHPGIAINKLVDIPTYNSQTGPLDSILHLARFLFQRKGVMTTPAVQGVGLARTQPGLAEPDVQLHFLPVNYNNDPNVENPGVATMAEKRPGVTIIANVCRPLSRGRVYLDPAEPGGRIRIAHELIGDPRDQQTLVDSCKLIERIFAAGVWRDLFVGDSTPSPVPDSDGGWLDYVRARTALCYHPIGTCRMGSDADAVVDPSLRVAGIDALRVVDASVMPLLPSANTNAAAIMIGERAADIIRGNRAG